MKSEVMSHFSLTWIPNIGLLLFVGLFVGCLFWVFRKGSGRIYGEAERLPLLDTGAGIPNNSETMSTGRKGR